MKLLWLLIIGVSVHICVSIKTRPVPIHGAKEIERILSRRLKFDGSLFSFIKGTQGNKTKGLSYVDENLDVNVLDIKTFRKILNLAKQKYKKNYRRTNFPLKERSYQTGGFKTHARPEPYTRNSSMFITIRDKVFDLMLQSIYATKERIHDTKRLRRHFQENPSYKIAVLYQTCAHHINKMETLFAQMRYFIEKTHFLWYLIIYERILQSSVDIEYAIGRMYEIDKTPMKGKAADINDLMEEAQEELEEGEEELSDAKKAYILKHMATSSTDATGPPPTRELSAAELAGGQLSYEWVAAKDK